ncbi:uncharacterized protein At4g22758-like [Magnolia sinica]|uniref:uncharacterized protein At4g22758-like n=1 Tax=Magnolia sinica TaxID=86752 RepID=UPI00265954C8|nr:uncharacterized protein At4g22758-like [Magnolia sinica]
MRSRSTPSRESDTVGRPASFHGRIPGKPDTPPKLRRPESHPELLRRRGAVAGNPISPENSSQRLTKLLLNVTVQRSLGPVHVVMSPESTVADLIKAALEVYVKEGMRPLLTQTDPLGFELHYSQFSLESLNSKEKLVDLGSRNFFLCPKASSVNNTCSNEATKASKSPFPSLIKFMDFLP